jgi:hypothetical protein
MSRSLSIARSKGKPAVISEETIDDLERQRQALDFLGKDDLYNASRVLFDLPAEDDYTYHAMTSVKLAEVQRVVQLGGVNGLHSWYRQDDGSPVRINELSRPLSWAKPASALQV